MEEKINLYVHGRICLLGELSDLVAPYLSENKELIPGCAVGCGIHRGIYATVEKSNVFEIEMNDKKLKVEMNEEKLRNIAESDDFFSYVCGTALYIKQNYNVKGIKVNITKMDLPIKRGLSSSAAICVLIAKAFNKLYKLNLDKNKESEIAYEGEHLAKSQCGRLDQSFANENRLSKIIFYEDHAELEPIKINTELNMLVVDLKVGKDTRKIMTQLNNCFPFKKKDEDECAHKLVGEENKKLVQQAIECIEKGDKQGLGKTLIDAQKLIDDCAVVCDELKAPVLHKVLEDKAVKELTYGGKGMGSGGDGSVQLLAKDRECQDKLANYLENNYGMETFKININN